MKKAFIALFAGCAVYALAASLFNGIEITPVSGTTTAPTIKLWNGTKTGYVLVRSPTGTYSYSLVLPSSPGSAGDCLQNTASAGVLQFGACGGSVPILVDAAAGTNRIGIEFFTSSVLRWLVKANNQTESGSNAGTNFQLCRYSDAGTLVDCPFTVDRASGGFSGSHIQNLGTGDNPTFNIVTSTLSAPTSLSVGGGNLTIGSTGQVSTVSSVSSSDFISSASYVRTATNFKVGTLNGITARLNLMSSSGSACTADVAGGMMYATTC
jgi:hypothetical protein